jgi:hypothetical protein
VSTANCILATRSMIYYTDCPFMIDNGAPHDLCSRALTNRTLNRLIE